MADVSKAAQTLDICSPGPGSGLKHPNSSSDSPLPYPKAELAQIGAKPAHVHAGESQGILTAPQIYF